MTKLTDEWVDKEILLAQESSSPYTPFNRQNNPSAFDAVKGTDADEVEVGKDPEEVFEQLELPLDLAAHDKQDDTAPDGWDSLTGLEWKIGPDGKPHFVYPDDEPPPAGIDLDKAEADLFQRIQKEQLLAGGPYRDNKEGNVDEVWDLTGDKLIGPMPKSFYDTTDKLKKKMPPIDLVELNPDQIEALKQIPANIKDLPDAERLDIMKRITEKVRGLA